MAGVVRPLTPPRGWPRRIRSAAVHAVSLAEFALTAALGWAAQSLNPRLRLRAELERLRQEIRIKDSRMTHIDPQKRSGRSVGGSQWSSTIARDASWASVPSVASPPRRPFGGPWNACSGAICPDTL